MSAMTSEDTPRKRSRGKAAYPRKGERTRTRIIETASELFADAGYRSVSLRDISARAGITHVGLLHHFASKEALLLEVLARRDNLQLPAEYDVTALDHDTTFSSERAMRIFAGTLEITRNNQRSPNLPGLYAKLSAEATDPEHPAHEYFHNRYLRVLNLFRAAFAARFADSPPPVDISAATAAQQLVALMDGLQLQWVLADATDATGESLLNVNMADAIAAYLASLNVHPTESDLASYREAASALTTDHDN